MKIAPPHAIAVPANAPGVGRHVLEKAYHGGLNGLAPGEMLTAGQLQQGQATYIALESFDGTLDAGLEDSPWPISEKWMRGAKKCVSA